MFKLIRMAKRGDKLPAEFRQEWLDRYRELRKTAGKVIASVAADGKPLGDDPSYQGMAALYYSTSAEAVGARKDEKGAISVVAEEKVLFEKPQLQLKGSNQPKVILTTVRKKDLTRAQFKDAALKGYAKAESKALMEAGVQKIVASFAAPEEKTPAFDGMLEIYFENNDQLKAAFASPVIAMLRKDEETFVQLDAAEIRIVAEEFVL
jgi:EthD domain